MNSNQYLESLLELYAHKARMSSVSSLRIEYQKLKQEEHEAKNKIISFVTKHGFNNTETVTD